MSQLVAENIARFGRSEITAFFAPADNRVHDAADELADGSFALRSVRLAVKIFRSDDVCRRLRPGLGDFDIFLAENHLAFFVAD